MRVLVKAVKGLVKGINQTLNQVKALCSKAL